MIQLYLVRKFKISDTCGVHNLHGMPAILGGLISVLMAGISTREEYDQYNMDKDDDLKSSLVEIFPKMDLEHQWTRATQAWAQLAAMAVTMVFALVGGFLTGFLL